MNIGNVPVSKQYILGIIIMLLGAFGSILIKELFILVPIGMVVAAFGNKIK